MVDKKSLKKELSKKKEQLKKHISRSKKKLENERRKHKKKAEEEIFELEDKLSEKIDELDKRKDEMKRKIDERITRRRSKYEERMDKLEKEAAKETEKMRKDILRTERRIYTGRQKTYQIVSFALVVYLFILGITFIKEGSLMLSSDIILSTIRTASPLQALGAGWLGAYFSQSGSGIIVVGGSFLGAGLLTFSSMFYLIIGTIVGNTSTPIIVSLFSKHKTVHDLRHGFELGVANLIFSLLLVVLVLVIELFTGFFTGLAKGLSGLLTQTETFAFIPGILDLMTSPLINLIPEFLSFGIVFLIIGFVLLLLSLKYIGGIIIKFFGGRAHTRRIINKYFSSRFSAFSIGFGMTLLVASNSLMLGLLVPLAVVGVIDLRKSIPFMIGAGSATFIDVLIASFATGLPLTISAGIMFMIICLFGLLFILHEAPVNFIYKYTRYLSIKVFKMKRSSIIKFLILLAVPAVILLFF